MSRQVINDGNGKPVSVIIDYQEWLGIEQLLEGKELNFAAPANPLDWYVLTETTNSVLNELIAYTSRERRKEMKQVRPDLARIKLLEELFEEVHSINSNPENFKSIGRMESIIGQYAPKAKGRCDVLPARKQVEIYFLQKGLSLQTSREFLSALL